MLSFHVCSMLRTRFAFLGSISRAACFIDRLRRDSRWRPPTFSSSTGRSSPSSIHRRTCRRWPRLPLVRSPSRVVPVAFCVSRLCAVRPCGSFCCLHGALACAVGAPKEDEPLVDRIQLDPTDVLITLLGLPSVLAAAWSALCSPHSSELQQHDSASRLFVCADRTPAATFVVNGEFKDPHGDVKVSSVPGTALFTFSCRRCAAFGAAAQPCLKSQANDRADGHMFTLAHRGGESNHPLCTPHARCRRN